MTVVCDCGKAHSHEEEAALFILYSKRGNGNSLLRGESASLGEVTLRRSWVTAQK